MRKKFDINIELGLQTVNYHTLAKINRGHGLAEFIDAVLRIKKHGFETCAYLILNLPWDTCEDAVENARILSAWGGIRRCTPCMSLRARPGRPLRTG